MPMMRIQGDEERLKGVYYEFDTDAQPLGEGGMGTVWRGDMVSLASGSRRPVAVKEMKIGLPPEVVARARREASIRLRNDHLVEMLGFIALEYQNELGETVRRHYVVSELLRGVSLESLLRGRLENQRGVVSDTARRLYDEMRSNPAQFAVHVARDVLSGLVAFHDAGYVHRDIDPSNIMVTDEGHIKLIDFGIAKKMTRLTDGDRHLTKTGAFMGKPWYAAPELVLGDLDNLCAATDLYAVGVVLFECCTGHVPFDGDSYEVQQHQLRDRFPLREVRSRALRRVIAKAGEKKRANRYASASAFRVALDEAAAHLSDKSLLPDWRPAYTWTAAGVAAVVVGVALAASLSGGSASDRTAPADDLEAQTGDANIVNPDEESEPADTYSYALASLKSENSAEGLRVLGRLSDSGDADATFLLSRLCFVSNKAGDYKPDSITVLQRLSHVNADCRRAHALLKKTVEQRPQFYQALYELACDYLGGPQRTDACEQDVRRADELFRQVKELARAHGDALYVGLTEQQMSKYVGKVDL